MNECMYTHTLLKMKDQLLQNAQILEPLDLLALQRKQIVEVSVV